MYHTYYYKRLRDLREDHDLTQKQVAELIKTTQQVYSEYEKGIREIPLFKMVILAKFYNVSMDYLTDLIDEKRTLR
ncbi:MAG: helix-turn-helix transcriptional regulator [Ruminococcus sp.]|nr:helix-turn-helix transcriptional regulator [Ruminococcus sp.]